MKTLAKLSLIGIPWIIFPRLNGRKSENMLDYRVWNFQ